jgi:hypothetical protein
MGPSSVAPRSHETDEKKYRLTVVSDSEIARHENSVYPRHFCDFDDSLGLAARAVRHC